MHPIIFATMLEFCEVPQRLGEPVSATMSAPANRTLDLQGRIRHHCDVVDTLKVNVDRMLRASILICMDLIYKSIPTFGKGGEDGRATAENGLVRQIPLGRVKEAIYRCQASKGVAADVEIIEGLLEVEERCWHQQSSSHALDSMPRVHPSSAPLTPAPPHKMPSTVGSLAMMGSPAFTFDLDGKGGAT